MHRVGDDVMSTRSAGDHKRQIAKDRSHKTRGRGRRHVPRLGKDPSSDYEIDVIDVIELDEDEAVEAFEATEPAPEMDPFDVTVLAEAPEPAPEMDPFDVTVLAEAPEPAPEMDLFDVTVLAEAPEPAPEMDPFDVTVLAEAPEPAKLPEESIEAPCPLRQSRTPNNPRSPSSPLRRTPPSRSLNLRRRFWLMYRRPLRRNPI